MATTLYEEKVAEIIKGIERQNLSDREVISKFNEMRNRYIEAVVNGRSPEDIVFKYIRKEAYRRVASRRGIKLSAAGDSTGKG